MTDWAKTRAEADAQQFTLPARYEDWGRFASLIDGYAIAEEMRLVEKMGMPQETGIGALTTWAWPQIRAFEQTGEWPVETVLELRLLLFFKGRQGHFCGEAEHETFKVVHSLLKAIAQRTGLPYDDPQAEVRFAEEEARWKARYSDAPRTETETDGPSSQPPPKVFGLLASLCTVGVIVINMLLGSGNNSILRTSGVIVLLLSVVFMFPSFVLLKKYGHVSEGGSYMHTTTVVDQGLYAVVRHPQYLGYMLLSSGFVLVTQYWLSVLFGIMVLAGFYLQAAAEEQYCAAHMGAPYEHYRQRVPRFNVVRGIARTLSGKSR
jgi:protein-S-isoprenylcysteine O-methyltransferase Ste14